MTYYSTGKSPYLPIRGKTVECTNATTVDILLKNGALVTSLSDLEVIPTIAENIVEEEVKPKVVKEVKPKAKKAEVPKRKGNPNWAKK